MMFNIGDKVRFIGDNGEYGEFGLTYGREFTIEKWCETCERWVVEESSTEIFKEDLELVKEIKQKLKVNKKGYC